MRVKILFACLNLLCISPILAEKEEFRVGSNKKTKTPLVMRPHMVDPAHDENLEKIGPILSCSDFIQQAQIETQDLYQWLQEQKKIAHDSNFESKKYFDEFNQKVKLHIIAKLDNIKILINLAEKEAGAAL